MVVEEEGNGDGQVLEEIKKELPEYLGPLTLPEFSPRVQDSLAVGDADGVWGRIIEELVFFYQKYHPNRMNCTTDYQLVGKLMYKAYPCIEKFGVHPWVRRIIVI